MNTLDKVAIFVSGVLAARNSGPSVVSLQMDGRLMIRAVFLFLILVLLFMTINVILIFFYMDTWCYVSACRAKDQTNNMATYRTDGNRLQTFKPKEQNETTAKPILPLPQSSTGTIISKIVILLAAAFK